MQKLWIVSELFPPDETSTSYILGEIANALTSKYDVNVICGPEIYDKRKNKGNLSLSGEVKVYRTQSLDVDKNTFLGKVLSFVIMSRRLYKMTNSMVEDADKLLVVTNPAPLVLLISRLRRRRQFEMKILVHDVFPENTVPAGIKMPRFIYSYIKKLFDKAYSTADRLIAIGRDMRDILNDKIHSYPHKPSISIIENWGDIENISPLPFPEGKIILQYAGNIGRVQGLENVMDHLPSDIELHIYGTGAMESRLKKRGKENVFFHGPYKRSEQTAILGACDIALVTLQEEMYGLGVPSKAYNIMASGRPILFLGPENSEIYMMVKENGIGYISWPETWNRDILKEMGAKARALAENSYSKDCILQKFVDII